MKDIIHCGLCMVALFIACFGSHFVMVSDRYGPRSLPVLIG